ncbi:hypothetical protein ACPCTK_11145 [Streptomyces pseudogriseolus]|uniref:hypothetical protein n=1 Tax=Streptomyces pseudogriseolus TaxID=36817 RepID=UPI003FA1F053
MSLDDAPAYVPPIRRDGSERDPHARPAPAVATVLGLLSAPPALFCRELSDMATDSCGPDDRSPGADDRSPELMSAPRS